MNTPLIDVKGLSAGYKSPVVGPISFAVSRGEILGIWGHNGCGKSTLLNAIAGIDYVLSGRIERAQGLRLNYLTQQPKHQGEMPFNGREYLSYAGITKAAPAYLSPLLSRRIDRLSGGQFQLLAIWAALGSMANLVLLDEPTNNLDPGNEKLLLELLHRGQEERGVILVSNERRFLAGISTQVLEVG